MRTAQNCIHPIVEPSHQSLSVALAMMILMVLVVLMMATVMLMVGLGQGIEPSSRTAWAVASLGVHRGVRGTLGRRPRVGSFTELKGPVGGGLGWGH